MSKLFLKSFNVAASLDSECPGQGLWKEVAWLLIYLLFLSSLYCLSFQHLRSISALLTLQFIDWRKKAELQGTFSFVFLLDLYIDLQLGGKRRWLRKTTKIGIKDLVPPYHSMRPTVLLLIKDNVWRCSSTQLTAFLLLLHWVILLM